MKLTIFFTKFTNNLLQTLKITFLTLFNKIAGLLKVNKNINIESASNQRIQLLSFTTIIILFSIFCYSIVHFIFLETLNGIALMTFFIFFLMNYIIYRKTENYNRSLNISLILLTVLFIYIVFMGMGNNTSIIWGLLYPIILALLIDFKKSAYLSIMFLLINIIVFIISNVFEFWADYSIELIIRYISVYLLIFLILQFYLRQRHLVIILKEKKSFEIQKDLKDKNNFLSNLSYQIRTPLNNIAGIINVQRDRLEEDIVEEVELSVSNLISIVNSIPDIFDKKAITIKGQKTFFNVNTVIKKSIALFQTERYKNLKFNLNLSNKLPQKVLGDRLALIQILISVIDFCVNHSSEEIIKVDLSTIDRVSGKKNFVVIKVKSELNKLTDHSDTEGKSQLDFESTKIREIELLKELTKSSSGVLDIISEEGNVSFLFTFNFPKEEIKEEIKTEEKTIKPDIIKESKKIALKDANILLVEDDIMNSKVMTLNLEKHVNKIIYAINGKDALEKYASTKIDLILMDLRMPLMDGFKTTEKIREAEIGTGTQTPIIAVTANVSNDMKERCYNVGMNDFAIKPINFKILIEKMENQLST